MTQSLADTDVLVVGAGPVGLFLANECARRGLRFRIIERHTGQSEHSKALAIFPRTLELFDMAGIVGEFLAAAHRVTGITVVTPRRTLACMPFEPPDTPYPFVAMIPQNVTERLLVTSLQNAGGRIEYQTSLVAAEQQADRVLVTVQRNQTQEAFTAAYVVACDGAHSTLRELLQLPFEGGEYNQPFMLADIETNGWLPSCELHLCPNRAGPLAIFPMSATRYRIVAMVDALQGDVPSLDLTRKLLQQRAPAGIEAQSLHWSGYFQIHHRCVSRLRDGRIFLAGDAAHIHSPFGGQGMNTGLQDVWNLAWKLDLCLHGLAGDTLLDSYDAERRPIIKNVIDTTHTLTRVMGTPSRFAEALRNIAIPFIARLPPFQHALVQRLSELGVAYPGSPIVEGSGHRYFDEAIRNGGLATRFLLLLGDAVEATTRLATQHLANKFDHLLHLRRVPGHHLVLVRPDGYVAFESEHGNTHALSRMRQLLERQIH